MLTERMARINTFFTNLLYIPALWTYWFKHTNSKVVFFEAIKILPMEDEIAIDKRLIYNNGCANTWKAFKKRRVWKWLFGHTNKNCYRIGHGGSLRGFAKFQTRCELKWKNSIASLHVQNSLHIRTAQFKRLCIEFPRFVRNAVWLL